jgi:hypothetical protein
MLRSRHPAVCATSAIEVASASVPSTRDPIRRRPVFGEGCRFVCQHGDTRIYGNRFNLEKARMKKHLLTAALVASTAASAQAETIGFSMQRFDDNFLTIVRAALEKRAMELGNVKVIIEDAQGDVSRQQS